MSAAGAKAALQGFRLQALYTLAALLRPGSENLIFHPEGKEDLDVYAGNELRRVIQVKAHAGPLSLSALGLSQDDSFLRRAADFAPRPGLEIVVATFGPIGPELEGAWAGEAKHRDAVAAKLREQKFSDEKIGNLFASVRFEPVHEAALGREVFDFLSKSLLGGDPQSAFDLLVAWLYNAAEERRRITTADVRDRITRVGRYLAERAAHHQEWFTTIVPLADALLTAERREELAREYHRGVSARFDHIIAGQDVVREEKLRRIDEAFSDSKVVIIHGASGQGKSTLVKVPDVRAFDDWLKQEPNGRGGYLGPQSRRHHLHALSGVFTRAISEGVLPMGSNPVKALLEKPAAPKSETACLEVDELALLLESARTLVSQARMAGNQLVLPCAYELLATFILTGAREGEIRRLQFSDLDFDSQTINISGTKTEGSNRTVPLHSQLREILLPYVQRLGLSGGYLFTTASGEPIRDSRSVLDTIAVRAGFAKGHVRTRVFRTSYITHRLACTDHGAPIDAYQVAREIGHTSLTMIMKVYGRVQRRRVRMEELAFRTDMIGSHLAARLEALYSPIVDQDRSGWKDESELIAQFLAAIVGMAPEDVAAATGISMPTVKRLQAGRQRGLQITTRTRIETFLQAI